MEITRAETEIDESSDSKNKNRKTFFRKSGKYWIQVRLFV